MRDRGEGTIVPIRTRTGRPSYRIAIQMPDGSRVWRQTTSKRQAERIRKQLVEQRELELDPTRQTLTEWLRSWLAGLADAKNERVRPRTLDHYRLVVERHIIPKLDPEHKVPLSKITAGKVQAWIDADEGSPRTVHHHHAVLRRALNVAVRQRLLTYNPANAVELPDVEDDKASPLTLDEARRLLEATRDDRLGILWRLALVTGLRQGELLGLVWTDVDGPTLTVRAQLQRLSPERGGDRRGWARTETKASRSVPRVALDPETARLLEKHRRDQALERQPDWLYWGHVFVTGNGLPYHQSEVLVAFKVACRKAGIAERRFHDLRHSSATLLRDAGVAEDTRMARLGHSTTAMARHYSQASEVQDRDAAERLARALGGAG